MAELFAVHLEIVSVLNYVFMKQVIVVQYIPCVSAPPREYMHDR